VVIADELLLKLGLLDVLVVIEPYSRRFVRCNVTAQATAQEMGGAS